MNPRLFGGYMLVETLGGGGTSVVYRAKAGAGVPDVAVKQLRPQFATDPVLRRRFLREAELARALDHPRIVRVLDVGEDDNVPFLVLELMLGETLRTRLDRERRLEAGAATSIFESLARALEHAHANGMIHRDVKPENVFITDAGVKLGDFGNARVVSLASVTGASLTWGTPEYVAPEVFMRGRADPRSDLFSLGVVYHEMLTGRLPWSRSETLAHLAGGPGAAKAPAPCGAGAAIDSLLAALLAFSPADRPASAEEILARTSGPAAAALQVATKCPACGARLPDDVPRCFSCGHEALRFAHDPNGGWQLVLEKLDDDPAATERLLGLLSPIARPHQEPLQFVTGARDIYSPEELKTAIALPAVMFSDLGEATARSLETLFRSRGLEARANKGQSIARSIRMTLGRMTKREMMTAAPIFLFISGTYVMDRGGGIAIGGAFGLFFLAVLGKKWHDWRKKSLTPGDRLGAFSLREQIASGPTSAAVLGAGLGAVEAVQAPEVRALLGDVATELYRLTRRVEQLGAKSPAASSEADLLRRTADAAPALIERLRRMAARLDDLDAALKGQSEGELMQAIARLERAAAAPGADRAALGASRRDLEATLERRHATEHERARLSARLCQLLGQLRRVYRQALAMQTPAEQQALALEAASAELDAALAAPA